MKQFQKICIMLVITLFALNTVASSALAACNCPEMKDQTMQMDNTSGDMPCHGMEKSDKESNTKTDSKKMAGCDSCGCGDCHISAAASLPNQLAQNQVISSSKNMMPTSDFMKSLHPYGIDYPPKPIS